MLIMRTYRLTDAYWLVTDFSRALILKNLPFGAHMSCSLLSGKVLTSPKSQKEQLFSLVNAPVCMFHDLLHLDEASTIGWSWVCSLDKVFALQV